MKIMSFETHERRRIHTCGDCGVAVPDDDHVFCDL
jgi:hypothetical protein